MDIHTFVACKFIGDRAILCGRNEWSCGSIIKVRFVSIFNGFIICGFIGSLFDFWSLPSVPFMKVLYILLEF